MNSCDEWEGQFFRDTFAVGQHHQVVISVPLLVPPHETRRHGLARKIHVLPCRQFSSVLHRRDELPAHRSNSSPAPASNPAPLVTIP